MALRIPLSKNFAYYLPAQIWLFARWKLKTLPSGREMIRLISLLALTVSPEFTAAFLPTKHLLKNNARPSDYAIDDKSWQPERKKSMLFMSNQFDVTRPVFDFLSFRTVRGDALIRYDALNQSEPIRILLYGIYSLVLLAAPSLSEAVGYGELGLLGRVGSAVGAVSFAGLFVRECSRRTKQLTRIEKELNSEMLPIRLPANALSDKAFSRAVTLKELRSAPSSSVVPPRILALCGTKTELQQALRGLAVLGRRLRQASVYVVPVSTEGSRASDWELPSPSGTSKLSWLADASDRIVWLDFFDGLSSSVVSEKNDEAKSTPSFRWFGLTSGGQSFGSGEGESPVWLQVLGQHLRPTELLDPTDKSIGADEVDTAKLLSAQTEFYQALTKGDLLGMNAIFSNVSVSQVTEVRPVFNWIRVTKT
jgi:hypothetical protein